MGNRVISQIKIGNEIFDIRDKIGPDGALHLIGINDWSHAPGTTTHKVTDGGSQTPYIEGEVIALTSLNTGDVVLQNSDAGGASGGAYQEFLWIQTDATTGAGKWELLGDEGSYITKGTKYTSQSTTSTGSVLGEHVFTGTEKTINLNGTIASATLPVSETDSTAVTPVSFSESGHTHTVNIGTTATDSSHTFKGTAGSGSTTFTPNVTISLGATTTASGHTFVGTEKNVTVSGTGAIGIQAYTYTPGGSVGVIDNDDESGHEFKGTTKTLSHSLTKGTVTSNGQYTPVGTISTPTLTLTPSKDGAVSTITMTTTGGILLGTVAANSEILELFNILASEATVVTGITGTVAQPSFTGTAATLTVTTTQAVTAIGDHTYTPEGTVANPHTFTGTVATLTLTLDTDTVSYTGTYKPEGSIKGSHNVSGQNTTITITITPSGTITGSHSITTQTVTFSKRLIAALSNAAISASGTYTPEGTVSVSGSAASGHSLSMAAHTHTINLSDDYRIHGS